MKLLSRLKVSFANLSFITKATIVAYLFIVVICGLFLFAVELDQQNQIAYLTQKYIIRPEVNSKSFENSNFEKVSSTKVIYPSQIEFGTEDNIIYYSDQLKLVYNGSTQQDTPTTIVSDIINTAEGVIINGSPNVVIFDPTSGSFKNLDSSIIQIIYYNNSFVYLKKEEGVFTIYQTNTLANLSTDQTFLGRFTPNSKFSHYEIRGYSDSLFVFAYTDVLRQGSVDIYLLENQSLVKVQELQSVVATKFGQNHVLITSGKVEDDERIIYTNTMIDFTNSSKVTQQTIDLKSWLESNSIFGNVLANRCEIEKNGTVYCLVKNSAVKSTNSAYKDSIVKYNPTTDERSVANKNIVFSASNIHISPSGQMYIVSQKDAILYKISI